MANNRKQGVERYEGGRIKRTQDERSARPHRQRVHDWARMMRAGELASPIGFLLHGGEIDRRTFDAGMAYRAAWEAAAQAMGLSALQVRGQNLAAAGGASKGQETQSEIERKQRAIKRLDAMEAFVGAHSPALRVLQAVVIRDEAPVGYEEVQTLKAALRRLVMFQTARRD